MAQGGVARAGEALLFHLLVLASSPDRRLHHCRLYHFTPAAWSAPSLSFFRPTCSLPPPHPPASRLIFHRAWPRPRFLRRGDGMDTALPSGHLGPPLIMRAPSRENFSTRRYDFSSLQKFDLHCMQCVCANVYRNRCRRTSRHKITIFHDNIWI